MSIGIPASEINDHHPPDETTPIKIPSVSIIGIGASAGGLEALENFFRGLPGDSGLAFVVVQHLDPNHQNHLAELLQRATPMPVQVVIDGMRIEANQVFVIPPNRDLAILHGVLQLLEQKPEQGLRLPIDFFFRSLADECGENTIAVILSGMGSDGTAGARAIREKAGRVFVQSTESAKFDGMPRSVIDAGLADEVAPAEELGRKIISSRGLPRGLPLRQTASLSESDRGELEKLLLVLRTQTRHDFTHYKTNTIHRRVERRMLLHRLTKLSDYVRYLRDNPSEADLLFKELLIGVTRFFRDPEVWEQLRHEVIPAVLSARPNDGKLRAWVPGCSTGEEAYSLAMIFLEVRGESNQPNSCTLQVFATDIDKDSVDTARGGLFPQDIVADVGEARLLRFFLREDSGRRVTKEIREMMVFAAHNVLMDPPFTKLDLISCRNLLIYLDSAMQQKLMSLFHYSLNPGGILVLGSAETVGSASELFDALPGMNRVFRRKESASRSLSELPAASTNRTAVTLDPPVLPGRSATANFGVQTESVLLRRFTPAAVLTTSDGDIVFIHGKTGKYLEPAVGKANMNLFAMAREGLGAALGEAFPLAVRNRETVVRPGVRIGENTAADLTILPLNEPEELAGLVLVVFDDRHAVNDTAGAERRSNKADSSAGRIDELLAEIQRTRQELLASRVTMQASQEELLSTNEELQCSNEELTTSKEEMQSVNEELQTVNQELTVKVNELTLASDDMKNLLNSTEIATLFLDDRLMIRRFTNQITGIIRLIPGDVGRPITDLVTSLDYAGMAEDAREVLRSLMFRETQVTAWDGRWFRVRIMPYRTQDNRIDGVVITFVDITAGKNLEEALRETESILRGRFLKQTTELDTAKALEEVLRQAQTVLESRLTARTSELKEAREHERPGSGDSKQDAANP